MGLHPESMPTADRRGSGGLWDNGSCSGGSSVLPRSSRQPLGTKANVATPRLETNPYEEPTTRNGTHSQSAAQ